MAAQNEALARIKERLAAGQPVSSVAGDKKKQPRSKVKPETPKESKRSTKHKLTGSASGVVTKEQKQPAKDAVVQAVPFNKKIKDVLDCLLKAGKPVTASEIHELTKNDQRNFPGYNLLDDVELAEALRNNEKVEFHNNTYQYKSRYDITSKQELLRFLKEKTEGISMAELKDTYPNILDDVKQLKADGKLYVLLNYETQQEIVYPVDETYSNIKIDEDIVALYRETQAPEDLMVLQAGLAKSKLRSATASQTKRPVLEKQEKQKKKQRAFRQRYVTNQHLPELFTTEQPTQID